MELIDQSGGAFEQKRASAELYFSTKERAFRILDSAAKMVRDTRLPTDV